MRNSSLIQILIRILYNHNETVTKQRYLNKPFYCQCYYEFPFITIHWLFKAHVNDAM